MRALVAVLALVLVPAVATAQLPPPGVQRPGMPAPRDNNQPAATGTSHIRGRIVAADTGQPLRRALVRIVAPELRENRSTSTDEQGRYEFGNLPAGRYSVTASKSGFVTIGYGQLRPLEPGKPVPLGDNETAGRIDVRLPRASVITGRVLDEYGEPVAGAMVQALQFRYMNGQKRPVMGATPVTTPDTGEFRLWGLGPGEFVISANLRDPMAMSGAVDETHTGYAPTYYPGTTNVGEAQRVTLGVGTTVTDLTIALALTRTARISGTVVDAEGRALKSGFVNMIQRDPQGGLTMMTGGSGGPLRPDGTFIISNVAPGDYTLRATAPPANSNGPGSAPQFSQAQVTVNGQDIAGVRLTPLIPVAVRGRLIIDPASAQTLHPNVFRISAWPRSGEPMMMMPVGPPELVKEDATFEFKAAPGAMLVQVFPSGPTPSWLLKSMRLNGIDITDTGVEFRSGEDVDGLEVEITARVPVVIGTVTNSKGAAATDYTVIAFPQDTSAWTTQAQNQIGIARPDPQGGYQIKSLRPGSYYIVAVEYVEQGQWTDPDYLETLRGRATRLTLGDAETRTVELKLSAAR